MQQLSQSTVLLSPMLETLPALAQHTGHIHPSVIPASTPSPTLSPDSEASYYSHLSTFLTTLTPLASSHPYLFQPHLPALLSFLPALILPTVDAGPTPTVSRPFPSASSSSSASSENGRQPAFVFPPVPSSSSPPVPSLSSPELNNEDEEDEKSTLRLSALEFMISLSEAKPAMVKKVPGWTEVVVRACLEGMGELDDENLEAWLREDVSTYSVQVTQVSNALRSLLLAQVRLMWSHRLLFTSNRWTGWRVLWGVGRYCPPRFKCVPFPQNQSFVDVPFLLPVVHPLHVDQFRLESKACRADGHSGHRRRHRKSELAIFNEKLF